MRKGLDQVSNVHQNVTQVCQVIIDCLWQERVTKDHLSYLLSKMLEIAASFGKRPRGKIRNYSPKGKPLPAKMTFKVEVSIYLCIYFSFVKLVSLCN